MMEGQKRSENPDVPQYQNLRYKIVFPQTSPNKLWTVFRKGYDQNRDTIAMVNHKENQSLKYYTNVNKYYFTSQSNLLLLKKNDVELINLSLKKTKHWSNVSKAEFLENQNKIIILLTNPQEKKDLQIWSDNQLVQNLENVEDHYTYGNHIFYTTSKDGKIFLYEIGKSARLIAELDSKPTDCVFAGDKESCWIIEKDGKKEIIYINQSEIYFLNQNLNIDFSSARIRKMNNDLYFIVSLSYSKSQDKEFPDIWYSNDTDLEKKFQGGASQIKILWNPLDNEAHLLADTDRSEFLDIGNAGYLLCFNPNLKNDYTKQYPDFEFYRYDIKNKKSDYFNTGGYLIYFGSTGRYFLSNVKDHWCLFDIESLKKKELNINSFDTPYFSEDDKYILFETEDGLLNYNLKTEHLRKIELMQGFKPQILNISKDEGQSNSLITRKKSFNSKKALILKMYDYENDRTSLLLYSKTQTVVLLKPTRQKIEPGIDVNGKITSYVAEDYNVPPYINVFNNGKNIPVYQSNKTDKTIANFFSERIIYYNSEGNKLTGILYYPLNLKKNSLYPMIVSVYQRQSQYGNQYLMDGFFERSEGLNIRSYLERSYFVFLPDIVFGNKGTGFSALDCINNALDALQTNKNIDLKKIGLMGYSHGGYEVNFIATHSDRFAVYASGAGNSDLMRSYFSFNYQFLKPFYWQFEDQQYKMPGSFENYKDLYIQNSPIYNVSKVSAPILLWAGTLDKNIDWNQVMEFYLGLKRNNKNAIALFYPDEAHGFIKPKNKIDIAKRLAEWFDFYLKDKKNIDWIIK